MCHVEEVCTPSTASEIRMKVVHKSTALYTIDYFYVLAKYLYFGFSHMIF